MLILMSLQLAMAGPFSPKTMEGAWPERQVQREFVMARGWKQLQLSISSKESTSYRDENGLEQNYSDGLHWSYRQFELKYRHAFSRFTTLYLHIPWVWSHLGSDQSATLVDTKALGDVHSGLVFQPWFHKSWSFAAQLDLKAPSGVEWPGPLQGVYSSHFLTGTGITNLSFFLHSQYRTNSYALSLTTGWVSKFASVVGYVQENDGFGNGRLDAGDEAVVQLNNKLQLHSDVMFSLGYCYSYRFPYKMGVGGPGVLWSERPELWPSSHFSDVTAEISYEPNRNFELLLSVAKQVSGSDTRWFAVLGLEEFSPQPGWVGQAEGVFRW